jgi:hypothetical protein
MAAIEQQKVFVHMRNRADQYKNKTKPPPTNTWKPFNSQWRNPQQDPNAMDTSQDKPDQGLQKRKISSQEERDMSNVWMVVWKEEYPEDLSKEMDKGKSSHASFAESQVTLHEIADRNAMAIKVLYRIIKDQQDPLGTIKILYAPDKSNRRRLLSGWSTTEA